MAKYYHITFIGSGNVASHLARALENAGHHIDEVYSPDGSSASKLISRLYNAEAIASLDFSHSKSEVFIIAIPDAAVEEVAQEVILPEEAILVHTSGTLPCSVLGYAATPHIGVFYPLQTFTKNKDLNLSEVPFLLEGESGKVKDALKVLAQSISKNVKWVDVRDRSRIHLAAVFASNFTNHLLTISRKILKNAKLDTEILQPLIAEVINKALEIGPEKAQTGPAIRRDLPTMDKHMAMLSDQEDIAQIYQVISQHILDTYHGK
jgi:predicted short-subunit dehydrogenase-like oxidoreductase (DUF2520 family)